eukprot:CCRYP_010734-RA/>CCRYP_010734-RA protein AED:0.34 eAED:0.34 QI:0/0/0/1/0/0/2/0/327
MEKSTGKMLNYCQLIQHPTLCDEWTLSSANEFGRLAQGVGGRIKGTNTIRFIAKSHIPMGCRKDITYGQLVCTVRPEKQEQNRTRFTVGGDRINYPEEVATPTAEMITAKILFNSIISTPGARFMTLDISNFYLMTPLKRPEYLSVKLRNIPAEIIQEYNLTSLNDPHSSVYILSKNGSTHMGGGGGHFFLSNNATVPPNNGDILNIAHIIKHVMVSITEAKLGALYITACEAVYLRIILEELGHRQPATPIQTDNAVAEGVINSKVQPKHTKAMDMRFHWLRDRECQEPPIKLILLTYIYMYNPFYTLSLPWNGIYHFSTLPTKLL